MKMSETKGTQGCHPGSVYRVGVQSDADPDYHMNCLLRRQQAFAPPQFEPGAETIERLRDTHVLVVGAGGLGCEVLKCLCLSGFRRLDVIDMDTIHVTNLHRQFLFREKHVGRPKAQVAAEALNAQYAHLRVHVTGHVGRLEEKDEAFYRQFQIIVAGLDSVEARRWLNATVHSLAETDQNGDVELQSCIPLLDGGSEGLKGQARCIFPFVTSCFECSLQSFPPQTSYPLCTLAETPRLPEHCIEYAMIVLWTQQFPDREFDGDNPEHLQWLYERAKQRAETFGIQGVTYRLTLGVTKRIIPAVASTNAIIAAMLVEEALKIATFCVCSSHDARIAGIDTHSSSAPPSSSPSSSSSSAHASTSGWSSERKKPDSPFHGDRGHITPLPSPSASSVSCDDASSASLSHDRDEEPPQEGQKRLRGRGAAANAEGTEEAPGETRREESSEGPPSELSGVQNYIMYMGETGVYTHTFEYAKNPDCVVCSGRGAMKKVVDPDETSLQDLLELLSQDPALNLKGPGISSATAVLFLQKPPQLRQQLETNLRKSLRELADSGMLKEGEELLVTDVALPSTLRLRLFFEKPASV
ncbi:NEDD8-activating enzyme E1 catalytic subunit [Toxoplasma gondii ME49]|uniref:NEDD8-activating enzyme E1 catalytic subunit n=1 Tax=Toxoplasma gondii (strain ATCC 50611 / Me49) TaxID=508771 RepID=S8F2L7_TOXGM|nr:NEDD8-activating enzyme E1 catalytic subunit [Toxoplasma gondii ME49]EPT27773.1 NEDD8-activating enzyme E1 catalytic subunit [Toxoplasma gondii ME49]|eukprot:XP_018636318.1 NEDD8-activating enzyme E1 catalytic subunit [Toxoplasma gondii ME49]